MADDEPLSKVRPPYDVGYSKPPKQHQFKKGQSGNPRGRPKSTRTDQINIGAILEEPLRVRVGDRTEKMHVFEAGVRKIANFAIKERKITAIIKFIQLCEKYELIASIGPSVVSPVVPNDWDPREWMDMLKRCGPPPWPGERDGLVKTKATECISKNTCPSTPRLKRTPAKRERGELLREVANQRLWITEAGKRTKRTVLEMVLLVLRSKVAEGNIRAMRFFDELLAKYGIQHRPRIGLVIPEPLTTEEWQERYGRPKPDSVAK